MRWAIAATVLLGHGQGWLPFRDPSPTAPPNSTRWTQLRDWAERSVPYFEHFEQSTQYFQDVFRGSSQSTGDESWGGWTLTLLDLIASACGWMIFGNAWDGVKRGCRFILQIMTVVILCFTAHYFWALCWPMVSLVLTLVLTLTWIVRFMVRSIGRVLYYVQRAFGGVPEAADTKFLGPGTGAPPETPDLRLFKGGSTAEREKWIVLRRDGKLAVFQPSNEIFNIKSSGLYVGVVPDSMRGDASLLSACSGYDRVHLCRHTACSEEGQHFKEYGLAQGLDPERFQLQQAQHGAKVLGQGMREWWASFWKPKPVPALDLGSESESEPVIACVAMSVRWSNEAGDHRLCTAVCKHPSGPPTKVLLEDGVNGTNELRLCPQHALAYLTQRGCLRCSVFGCEHLGSRERDGCRLCEEHFHKQASRTRSSSKSPSAKSSRARSRSREPLARPEAEAISSEPAASLKDIKRLLEKIKKPDDTAEGPSKVLRRRSRSPGGTPKATGLNRHLARLGMLDSPDSDRPPLLEDFFHQYAEGKDEGLQEEDIRSSLASKRGMNMKEVVANLIEQASREQHRGQRGMTRFIQTWKRALEDMSSLQSVPTSSVRSLPSSWEEIVPPFPSPKVTESSQSPSTLAVGKKKEEIAPAPTSHSVQVKIAPPAIYGQSVDRKAGAGGGDTLAFEEIAKAIQSQTAEIASLVKTHTESSASPAGTLKGLGRQSEELVFLVRACNQYAVVVGAGEQGQSLANALLSAQVGAATKLRKAGFKQKVTQRLAISLAGPYWGTHEKYSLSAADFLAYTDAELDAYVMEMRSHRSAAEQRPTQPNKFEEWEARVRRQTDVWCLVYGDKWRAVKTHALETLAAWHQAEPHKWPLNIVAEVWEELHWRFCEELKEILRRLKKEAGRETMSLPDIKFHALLPDSDGQAWLRLPSTFDILNPDEWFCAEVRPRIERRQERMLWKLTWDGNRRVERPPGAHAGAEDPDGGGGAC